MGTLTSVLRTLLCVAQTVAPHRIALVSQTMNHLAILRQKASTQQLMLQILN